MNLYTFKKTDLCSQPKAFDANKIENFQSNRANQYSQYDITITVVYLFSSARMHASTDLFCSLFANHHFLKIETIKCIQM